jgi:hypothetical protein
LGLASTVKVCPVEAGAPPSADRVKGKKAVEFNNLAEKPETQG